MTTCALTGFRNCPLCRGVVLPTCGDCGESFVGKDAFVELDRQAALATAKSLLSRFLVLMPEKHGDCGKACTWCEAVEFVGEAR